MNLVKNLVFSFHPKIKNKLIKTIFRTKHWHICHDNLAKFLLPNRENWVHILVVLHLIYVDFNTIIIVEKCLDNNVILVLKKVFIGFMLFFYLLFWGETWHSFVRFSQIEYHADSYFNIWCVTSISTSPANQFIGWVMYIFKFISSVWATLDSPFGTAVKCYFCISLSLTYSLNFFLIWTHT